MKNLSLKSKILLAAIMVGSLGAGATEIVKSVSNAGEQTYDWIHYDRNGNVIGNLPGATVDQARDQLGCPGNVTTLCAESQDESQKIFYD